MTLNPALATTTMLALCHMLRQFVALGAIEVRSLTVLSTLITLMTYIILITHDA
jgi:hypothetical protein